MIQGLHNSASGLRLAQTRLQASARDTASLSARPALDVQVAGREGEGGVVAYVRPAEGPASALSEAVEQIAAARHFEASARAVQAQDEMLGSLLDMEA